MERARQRRQELLERGDPDEQFAEFRDRLEDVEATERDALRALAEEAESSGRRAPQGGDRRRRRRAHRRARRHAGPLRGPRRGDAPLRVRLLGGARAVRAALGRAARPAARLVLRGDAGALSNPDPEQLRRLREGMDALSRMLEQRERGEELDPSFEEFMAQYGDLFGPAETARRAARAAARRMAAARAMFESLSAEQRAELERLAQSLFEDLDLDFSLSRLASNLSRAFPEFDGVARLRASRGAARCRSPTRRT